MTRLFISSETLMLSMLQRVGDTWSGLNENITNKYIKKEEKEHHDKMAL